MFSLFSFKIKSVQGRQHIYEDILLFTMWMCKISVNINNIPGERWATSDGSTSSQQRSSQAFVMDDLDLPEEERPGKMWCISHLPITMGLPSSCKSKILHWAVSQIYWTPLEKAIFREKTEFSLPSHSSDSEGNVSILTKKSKQHMGCWEHFHKMTTLNWFLALGPQKLEQQPAPTFLPP